MTNVSGAKMAEHLGGHFDREMKNARVRAAVSANPDSAKSKNAETAKTVDEPFAPLGATTSVRSTQASAR